MRDKASVRSLVNLTELNIFGQFINLSKLHRIGPFPGFTRKFDNDSKRLAGLRFLRYVRTIFSRLVGGKIESDSSFPLASDALENKQIRGR